MYYIWKVRCFFKSQLWYIIYVKVFWLTSIYWEEKHRSKRILAIALALVLALGCIAGIVSADEASYTAMLGFANSDWSAQEWGDNANTTVTGAGEYSVSRDGAASGALVFVVDIAGTGEAFAAAFGRQCGCHPLSCL